MGFYGIAAPYCYGNSKKGEVDDDWNSMALDLKMLGCYLPNDS